MQLWCGPELSRSPAVHEYFAMLDLSSGRALFERCDAIWKHLGKR
ncbi:hypothetical protein [Chlorobium sp. N1]|nr:hypothetical protein [Chlorobium sp. N1]